MTTTTIIVLFALFNPLLHVMALASPTPSTSIHSPERCSSPPLSSSPMSHNSHVTSATRTLPIWAPSQVEMIDFFFAFSFLRSCEHTHTVRVTNLINAHQLVLGPVIRPKQYPSCRSNHLFQRSSHICPCDRQPARFSYLSARICST